MTLIGILASLALLAATQASSEAEPAPPVELNNDATETADATPTNPGFEGNEATQDDPALGVVGTLSPVEATPQRAETPLTHREINPNPALDASPDAPGTLPLGILNEGLQWIALLLIPILIHKLEEMGRSRQEYDEKLRPMISVNTGEYVNVIEFKSPAPNAPHTIIIKPVRKTKYIKLNPEFEIVTDFYGDTSAFRINEKYNKFEKYNTRADHHGNLTCVFSAISDEISDYDNWVSVTISWITSPTAHSPFSDRIARFLGYTTHRKKQFTVTLQPPRILPSRALESALKTNYAPLSDHEFEALKTAR
jgi:hypothetical protein